MNIVLREDAKRLGLSRYFEGAMCRAGHIAERATVNSQCVVCRNLAGKASRAKKPEHYRSVRRKRYQETRDQRIEYSKRWRVENLDRVKDTKRAYYEKNKATILQRTAEYTRQNPKVRERALRNYATRNSERIKEVRRLRREMHPERAKEKSRRDYQGHKPRYRANWSAYRARKINAMPPWADRDAIRALYEEARRLTDLTGIPHDVDHLFPLKSDVLCGLHIAENLRVIPSVENRRKGNSLPEGLI